MKKRMIVAFLGLALGLVMAMPAWADYRAGVSAYRQGNYGTALREFKADESAEAQFYLSLMYEKGDGVPQDREKAIALLRLAAESGLDVAQADLGLMYCEGMGVRQDMEEGLEWLRAAAEQGLAEAQMALRLARENGSTVPASTTGKTCPLRRSGHLARN